MNAITVRRPTTIAAPQVPSWSSERDIGVRRSSTADLPAVEYTAVLLARGLVEVLSGRRAPDQVAGHCAPAVSVGLRARPAPGPLPLPHLMTVRVCQPADGVAEVAAVFRRGRAVHAVAFRLQGLDGRWRITALELG